jgi:hypothetical protein
MKLEVERYRPIPRCSMCERGFKRRGGVHLPSQRLGMIPESPCRLVEATPVENGGRLPWIAYVRGHRLITDGEAWRPVRFGSKTSAIAAALKLLEDIR